MVFGGESHREADEEEVFSVYFEVFPGLKAQG